MNPALPLPRSFARDDLQHVGFTGWLSWSELRASGLVEVPELPAAYVVHADEAAPAFVEVSPAGWFKGKDPSVGLGVLETNWVRGTRTVYIGKADNARRRLTRFARFGAGEPVGHWGGRLIWQLQNPSELRVAWHQITWLESARDYEKRLLSHFANLFAGQRPFANLTG